MEELRDLLKILKEGTGDFACNGFLPELCLPGLVIENIGDISLPVQEEQAKKIIEVAKKAPFGLGAQTLVNETVRKTWQLEPDQITIKNEHFVAGVENVVSAVKKHLGCNKKAVQANLYKVLMYEKGGHFKAHRDTEKENGMFATMVIQLPSKFEGGKLTVRHAGEEKVIEMDGERSVYCCKYAAHYSDCTHEVSEVTSGYRLALVYSLCWTAPGDPPSADSGSLVVKRIANLLPKIFTGDRILFSWFLSHKYSESSLSGSGIDALKGADEIVARTLQQANQQLLEGQQFEFYIAEVQRELRQFGDFPDESDYSVSDDDFEANGDEEEDINIEKWFGMDGTPSDLKITNTCYRIEDNAVNYTDKNKMWGMPYAEENSGPTGNEGATQTYWYNSYAIFGWRKDEVLNLRSKLCGYENAIKWFSDKFPEVPKLDVSHPEHRRVLSDLRWLVDFAISNVDELSSGAISMMFETLAKVSSEAVKLTNLFLTKAMIERVKKHSSYMGVWLNESVIKQLVHLTVTLRWCVVSKSLKKLFQVSSIFHHGSWAEFLKSLYQKSDDKEMLLKDACFKSIVACLVEKIETDAQSNQLACWRSVDRVNAIASFLFLLGKNDLLALFTNAISAFCQHSPKSTLIQHLVVSLEKEKLDGDNQFWIQLVNLRIVQLEEVEKVGIPPFTWKQDDAVIDDHPQVQEFLRSPNQTMRYRQFTSISQARRFASKYFGPEENWSRWSWMAIIRSYTATATTGGTGQNAYVQIEKTREYYEEKIAPVKEQLEELEKLRAIVGCNKSSANSEQLEPQAKRRAIADD